MLTLGNLLINETLTFLSLLKFLSLHKLNFVFALKLSIVLEIFCLPINLVRQRKHRKCKLEFSYYQNILVKENCALNEKNFHIISFFVLGKIQCRKL